MKIPLIFFVVFVLFYLFPGQHPAVIAPNIKKDSLCSATISFTGDLMCHIPQLENARVCEDSFDFSPCFSYVKDYLLTDDLTIGNFETTCSGKEQGYSGYPAFNTPDAFVHDLKKSGFDFLGTANNHAMDRGEYGLLRTLRVVRETGLGYAGTFCSQEDRDSVRILSLNGIKTAVLNYTYGTNGAYPSGEHKYMLAVIDTNRIREDMDKARLKGAEIVAVFFHFGEEMRSDPTLFQDSVVNFAIRAGADLIIGSHPHVIGPVKFFKTVHATLDSGFIAYSLGNFFSNQYWRYTDAGVVLTICLEKNRTTGKISIQEVDYLPTWVYRGTNPARKIHIIIPAEMAATDTTLNFLDRDTRQKAHEALEDTRNMFGRCGNRKIKMKSGK